MKITSSGDIPVLMYRFINRKTFELHLRILKLLGYETITFKDLAKIGLTNRREKKYIIITIDDGDKSDYTMFFPILKKFNMKAVLFITSESNSKKLSKEEIKELHESGLIEFGGHSENHKSMITLSKEELEKEILENKYKIEKIVGEKVLSFAYPYGHKTKRIEKAVRDSGYIFAVSIDTGTGFIGENPYDIRRTKIDENTSLFDFLRKISPKYLRNKYEKRGSKEFKDEYEK